MGFKYSLKKTFLKEAFARTRTSDSKNLPAVILNIFCVNIPTSFMFDIVIPTKRIKFNQGFL